MKTLTSSVIWLFSRDCTFSAGIVAGLLIPCAGCSSLPSRHAEPAPTAVIANPGSRAHLSSTSLSHAVTPALAEHPGLSGVYPLNNGMDAFVARLALAGRAERTIDAQYYIWHADDAGKLLANQLLQAADRGVHVHLLLDDIGSSLSDAHLLALDSHTNIEVRIFNPIANRTFRRISLLFNFRRANRRMHNKSFTVDGQVTIVGGRNIGDEYFGLGSSTEFADLDAMAVGPVVDAAARAFDLYWGSAVSIPMASVNRKGISAKQMGGQRAALAAECERLRDSAYIQAEHESPLMNQLREHSLAWFWGEARLTYDLPEKVTTSTEDRASHLVPQLLPILETTKNELLIVSPYFVPGKEGVKFFEGLRKRGVRVVIITNSLGATDVPAVHAGYRRYRKALLRAGVELYEFKPTAANKPPAQAPDVPPSSATTKRTGGGSSRASLHAKTFMFDRRQIFVGSLNLDPRSVILNTEIGAVFNIPELASSAARTIDRSKLEKCYRLEISPKAGAVGGSRRIIWVAHEDGQAITYSREPAASLWRRFYLAIVSLLPIESQL